LLSGLTITPFIWLHLLTHVCRIFWATKPIEIMNALRLFYRNIFVETILLSAILVQIVSGLKSSNANRKTAISGLDKLNTWTGLYLAIFFVIHLNAVLGDWFFLNLDINFYFGVAGLNSFSLNLFFIPSYALAIFSFFAHIACVHNKKNVTCHTGFTTKYTSKPILT